MDLSVSEIEDYVRDLETLTLSSLPTLHLLTDLDWYREDLTSANEEVVAYAHVYIRHHRFAGLDSSHMIIMGSLFQLLGQLRRDAVATYFEKRPSGGLEISALLDLLSLCIDLPQSFFPSQLWPESEACGIASKLIEGALKHRYKLFQGLQVMKQLSALVYRIWIWGNSPVGSSVWKSYSWRTVGRIGLRLLQLYVKDRAYRQSFADYCARDGGLRWTLASTWLIGRGVMLSERTLPLVEDIGGMIELMHAFTVLSMPSATILLHSRLPHDCLNLLARVNVDTTSIDYLEAAALLIRTIGLSLTVPATPEYMKTTRQLLRSGVLSPVRDVVLYAGPAYQSLSVRKTWEYLYFVVSSMMDYKTLASLARAFMHLPPDNNACADHHHLSIWRSLEYTLTLFTRGYIEFVDRAFSGICDNVECTAENGTHRLCSVCNRVIYCSDDCQEKAWFNGHITDCQLYTRDGVFSPAMASVKTRTFLLYVLGSFIHEYETVTVERNPESTCSSNTDVTSLCSVFHIGPNVSNRNTITIQALMDYARRRLLPSTFAEMLVMAGIRTDYRTAMLSVTNQSGDAFYVFGLFKSYSDSTRKRILPVKGMELTGLEDLM